MRMLIFLFLAAILPAIALADSGGASKWSPVPNLNGLLAKSYATGKVSHGILTGPAYSKMPPMKVTVSVAGELPQAGCKQMRIVFDQKDVILPGSTKPQNRHAGFFMPYCKGGALPSSVTAPFTKAAK